MSHQPERTAKDCLNCGTIVQGRFCHICGQENIVVKQSALSMVQHFVYDIFHFDGKFFETVVQLFKKPGLVSKEYVSGKRVSYLDPIRMYLFTSAIFFLIFFSINDIKINDSSDWEGKLNRQQRIDLIYELRSEKNQPYSLFRDTAIRILTDSTYQVLLAEPGNDDMDSMVSFRGTAYKFVSRKDTTSVSDLDLKDGNWIERTMAKIAKKYEDDPKKGYTMLLDTFMHRIPYMLFVSLPFFAFILQLVYLRRKQFFYHDHLIFTLYHYIFSFIVLLVMIGTSELEDRFGWAIFIWINAILLFYWLFHLYKSMRFFYVQSRSKTIVKFLLVNLLGLLLIQFLFFIFLLITAIQL